jgi:hypothetical protein
MKPDPETEPSHQNEPADHKAGDIQKDPETQLSQQEIEAYVKAYRKILAGQVAYARKRYPGMKLAADMTDEEREERHRRRISRLEKAGALFHKVFAAPSGDAPQGSDKG